MIQVKRFIILVGVALILSCTSHRRHHAECLASVKAAYPDAEIYSDNSTHFIVISKDSQVVHFVKTEFSFSTEVSDVELYFK